MGADEDTIRKYTSTYYKTAFFLCATDEPSLKEGG